MHAYSTKSASNMLSCRKHMVRTKEATFIITLNEIIVEFVSVALNGKCKMYNCLMQPYTATEGEQDQVFALEFL